MPGTTMETQTLKIKRSTRGSIKTVIFLLTPQKDMLATEVIISDYTCL